MMAGKKYSIDPVEAIIGTGSGHDEKESFSEFESPSVKKPARETKSRHLQLLVKPSTYQKIYGKAEAEGKSLNSYLNELFESL